jgi:predicted helicase
MSNFKLKASHAPVKDYYATLEKFGRGKFDNEGNIRRAFESLLEKCARPFEWFLVSEYPIPRTGKSPLKVDAAILDAFNLPRGYWEAKDEKDDLMAEMNKKFALGYPRTNILFQKPTHAILFQDGRIVFNDEIVTPEKLVDVLRLFFEWRQPHQEDWDRAVREFSERIPEIAKGAMTLIAAERKTNPTFVARFTAFADLCRESINPDLKDEAVEEMLVQHLLTERIFRRIFDNPEFTRRNVIAAEIEKVIDSLTKRHFSRDSFLRDLDPFYKAIEETAATASDYSEKQAFLNSVYERFFQGFSKKQADTHGIVYTPQPIVDFMVRSVEEVLKNEFGRSLSDKGVHILDPFVGTGNFITRVMKEIRTSSLPHKYKEELHCNEIMLLPYYIASMNIEHAYLDRVDEYESFEGICLVDTFEIARQESLFTSANSDRVKRQRSAPIRVVIANPPYNVGQKNENEKNKNRIYKGKEGIDRRVAETYAADSAATSLIKLQDVYVKAFRWASDRIGNHGIVCLVSNNGFLDQYSFDGMRKNLASDFSDIYIVDLGGDVYTNPKLSGTTHNVFGIQVGVSITVAVRSSGYHLGQPAKIFYANLKADATRIEKLSFLEARRAISGIEWKILTPDRKGNWLTEGQRAEYEGFLATGSKESKRVEGGQTIFNNYCLGVASNRDIYNYNENLDKLRSIVKQETAAYNEALSRYKGLGHGAPEIDDFVDVEDPRLKWTRQTKRSLADLKENTIDDSCFRIAGYRPYRKQHQYFQDFWNEERYQQQLLFPLPSSENKLIVVAVYGRRPFAAVAVDSIPDINFYGEPGQCFPFYTYDEDGTNRRENITDWSLAEFRKHYGPLLLAAQQDHMEANRNHSPAPAKDLANSLTRYAREAGANLPPLSENPPSSQPVLQQREISKWDIFHYTYALLHHPEYRTRYAANLKRELPRIPMAPALRDYARIGAALMDLHINYEQQPEYDLPRTETGQLNWRVEKMSLSKDKTQLKYNSFLTLNGIPPQVYDYRLGNRSALEWVVDQYRVSTDARSGIVNDPNRYDDPEYIVRLIGQVVTVSLETVKLVAELAALSIDQA